MSLVQILLSDTPFELRHFSTDYLRCVHVLS